MAVNAGWPKLIHSTFKHQVLDSGPSRTGSRPRFVGGIKAKRGIGPGKTEDGVHEFSSLFFLNTFELYSYSILSSGPGSSLVRARIIIE